MIKHTLLCVDDEIDNLDALERVFRSKYNVLRSTSGREALETLDQNRDLISVIITDQRMPEMTGVEFLEKSITVQPEVVRILLTGYTDMESIVAAVNSGQIYRYLNKPWDSLDLLNTVGEACAKYEMQRELFKKNEKLKELNTDLTVALEELKTLDQAKNQFMMLINHELKTPLTSILSYTELMKESELAAEPKKYVERIEQGGHRLKSLIDDVLLLTSAESKQIKIKTSPFLFEATDVLLSHEMNQQLQNRKISFVQNRIEKKLLTDRGLLQQVLQRLLDNALRFTDDMSSVSLKMSAPTSHRVLFEIEDHGKGIDENKILQILKPFYIDETAINHSKGRGLGLSICTSVLRMLSSQLRLENTGTGLKASFEIPCL
jgi:two-component system, sensor histidine kinase and response regulator